MSFALPCSSCSSRHFPAAFTRWTSGSRLPYKCSSNADTVRCLQTVSEVTVKSLYHILFITNESVPRSRTGRIGRTCIWKEYQRVYRCHTILFLTILSYDMYHLNYKKYCFSKYGEAVDCAKESASSVQRPLSLPHPHFQRKR